MNRDKLIVIVCLVVMAAIYLWFKGGSVFPPSEKDMRSLVRAIKTAHKPRVVYFFATWCGACAAYGPVLKDAVSLYSESIDFQSVNVGDPTYNKLISQYGIQSVPTTIIFNAYGQLVLAEGGCIDRQTLNDTLSNIYKSTLSESASKSTKSKATKKKRL